MQIPKHNAFQGAEKVVPSHFKWEGTNQIALRKSVLMGNPYKTEFYQVEGKPLEFWLYLTEGKNIYDHTLRDSNFTPLAFEDNMLTGWGRNYYDNVLRIKQDIKIEKK